MAKKDWESKCIRCPYQSKCYKAVMCAFKCMLDDEPEKVALEAAKRVYRYHHPNDPKEMASLTVERWVSEGRVQ